jgi:hypothetical protein
MLVFYLTQTLSFLLVAVFCDLALLLGLADSRRFDRSQLQALIEVLRVDLVHVRAIFFIPLNGAPYCFAMKFFIPFEFRAFRCIWPATLILTARP